MGMVWGAHGIVRAGRPSRGMGLFRRIRFGMPRGRSAVPREIQGAGRRRGQRFYRCIKRGGRFGVRRFRQFGRRQKALKKVLYFEVGGT